MFLFCIQMCVQLLCTPFSHNLSKRISTNCHEVIFAATSSALKELETNYS